MKTPLDPCRSRRLGEDLPRPGRAVHVPAVSGGSAAFGVLNYNWLAQVRIEYGADPRSDVDRTELVHAFGFYDRPHFIREVLRLCGLHPSAISPNAAPIPVSASASMSSSLRTNFRDLQAGRSGAPLQCARDIQRGIDESATLWHNLTTPDDMAQWIGNVAALQTDGGSPLSPGAVPIFHACGKRRASEGIEC